MRLLETLLACGTLIITTACLKAEVASSQVTRIGSHLRFAGETVRLTSRSDGGHALVSAHVGDRGPFNFIVDTGSAANVIDRALAEEMGLRKVGQKDVLSGGIEPVNADVVLVPLLRVDGLTVEDAEFLSMDLDAMSLGRIQGVLGMELFREALLTLDPRNDRITVAQGELSVGGAGVMSYRSDAGSGFQVDAMVVNPCR